MVTTEKVGQRIYVVGDSYAIKDKLKAEGCHWDSDRKQWWIGIAKSNAITHLLANAKPEEAKLEDPDSIKVIGKVLYKGKHYYVRWKGHSEKHGCMRARLVTLDGKLDFYVSVGITDDTAKIVKTYSSQVDRRGYETFMTLGKIRRFIEEQKSGREQGKQQCAECGKYSNDLHHDLEDGMMKCYGCCDIPQ